MKDDEKENSHTHPRVLFARPQWKVDVEMRKSEIRMCVFFLFRFEW
jgi:hypothetical protein